MTPFDVPDDVGQALEENLWRLWARFGRGAGCTLYERDDAMWFDTPIPTLPYNGVMRFAVTADVDRRIAEVFEHFAGRDVPFMWVVHPSAQPTDLDARLRTHGMDEVEVATGMWAPLESLPEPAPPPAGIEVREAITPDDVSAALELVAWRWEVAPGMASRLEGFRRSFRVGEPGSAVRCWIAWKEGRPVSKVILNLDAGAAGLYGVATRPEARGQGLARTLTLSAFGAARAAGFRVGVLHSSPMAYSLYERLGFRPAAPFRIFAPPVGFHI